MLMCWLAAYQICGSHMDLKCEARMLMSVYSVYCVGGDVRL